MKTQKTGIIHRWLSPALVLVAFVATAVCLLTFESEYLWKVQELNLFMDTPLFLRQRLVESAGLLTWLGAWFTDFFYYPWAGVLWLCGWWLLLLWMTARTFRIPRQWAVLLLIPVAALLVADVSLGYWVYYLKLHGHFFVGTIGTTLAVAAVWLFRTVKRPVFMVAYIVVSSAVLYPVAGFYGLLSTLLCGVLVWRLEGLTPSSRLTASAVAVAAVILWPLFYYYMVYYQTNMLNIYWTGLPLFVVDEEYFSYYIPYIVLAVSLASFAATYRTSATPRHLSPIVQVLIFAVLVAGVSVCWYKDGNFHKELRMQQCIDRVDWEGVRRVAAAGDDEPSRAIVMMRNLALFRLGSQGNTMYQYPNGSRDYATQLPVSLAQIAGLPLFFHYGQTNYCYRWCMEYSVEIGWSAENLKYMTRCAMVNGDLRVARKYINMLKHTRFHRSWAQRYEQLIGNAKALHADSEFEPVFHLATSKDHLGSVNMPAERFLITEFLKYPSDDPLCQEQAVYSALWVKDIPSFWGAFFRYVQSHPDVAMPVHFQEAAILYGHLEHSVDISKMPFDPNVRQNYQAFVRTADQYASMSEEEMARMLYPVYGQTFYYEYYFVRNLKTN
jgi:hypothetical protein